MQTTHARKPFPVHIFVFLAPAVIIYTIFMVYPLLNSLRLSFFTVSDQKVETFVGLQNYITLLTDPDNAKSFWNAFQNNLVFFAIHMLVQNPIGLLLAALLASGGWGRRFYRTTLFMPTVLSVVIIGFIWQLILNPLWGVAESLLKLVKLGFLFKPWLGLPATALMTVSLISVWQFVGIPMILFYTALIGIPEELVEAAHVDGASGWQYFLAHQIPVGFANPGDCGDPDLCRQLQRLRPDLHDEGRSGWTRISRPTSWVPCSTGPSLASSYNWAIRPWGQPLLR